MYKDIAILIFAILFSGLAYAGESRPEGENCEISIPPANSGEEMNHGATLKIYPRAKDIGESYSGCQSLWAPNNGGWVAVAVSEYVNGDPVRLWSPHEIDPDRKACLYSKGKLVEGNNGKCPVPESLVIKSMPSGCVEKLRNAVAKIGLSAPRPQGCSYE